MEIIKITDKTSWDVFVSSLPHSPFLQSWSWGEFQRTLGHEVIRIAILDQEKYLAGAQILLMKRRLGSFLYIPFGPAVNWSVLNPTDLLIKEIVRIAQEKRVDYIRIDPPVEKETVLEKLLKEWRFKTASSTVQVDTGWILNLSETEENLLSKMRKTTRYLIRKAEKIGVKIEVTTDSSKLDHLTSLIHQTAKRQTNFFPVTDSYLNKQFEILSKNGMAKLYLAKYKNEILAAAIVLDFGDSYTYLHSGSISSDIPANYLLQWRIIQNAKKAGKKYYDFWGIASTDSIKHPWYGVSLFKRGFGGERVDYTGAWDLSLTWRYQLVRLIESCYKIRRGI